MTWLIPTLRWVVPLLTVWLWATDGHAYAWMLRHGYAKCSTCHTDPSGGETLSHMGRVQSQLLLSMFDSEQLTDSAKLLHGVNEPDSLRLGGSLRGMGIYTLADDDNESDFTAFPMQADVYGSLELGAFRAGGSVGIARVEPGSPHLHAAQVTEGQDGYQMISRSHWLGVELGEHSLLRAGRLNLPFGIRIPEHVMWARDATKTDRESDQQHGLAFAHWGDSWRGEWMFVLGNYQISPDEFRERGYAGYVEFLLSDRVALGASSMILQSRSGPHFNPVSEKVLRHAHGVTARYAPVKELAVMLEADGLKTTGSKLGYTGFVQADLEPVQGLHFLLTGEALDNGAPEGEDVEAAPGAGEALYGAWVSVNWFPIPHLDVRVDAVLRQESAKALQAQLHYYF